MMGAKVLSRAELEALPEGELQPMLEEMGSALTTRVLGTSDFDDEVEDIIREMRAGGHDLYLFDSNGEWQVWCGDWTGPEGGGGKLILRFDTIEGVEASWSKPEGSV